MEATDFKPKWAFSKSRRTAWVSSNKLLVAYDYFMKTIPVLGGPATYYMHPKMSTKSFCTLPELGEVAQTRRLVAEDCVAVDHYPAMLASGGQSGLKPDDGVEYFEMFFLGAEFLVLQASFKSRLLFQLWNWKDAKMVSSVSTPLFPCEVETLGVKVHPLRWYRAAAKSNFRVIVLDIKSSKDRFYLEMNFFFIEDDAGNLTLKRACNDAVKKNSLQETPHSNMCLTLLCFCWLAESKVIIATSSGVFKAGLGDLTLKKLGDLGAKAASMDWKGSSLYVAYETGLIEVVSIDQDKWDVKQAISAGQPLAYACLSPDSKYLTVTTQNNSIIGIDVDRESPERIGNVSGPDFGEIVDVGFLGPVLSHCVVAEKSGALHIVDETSGDLISTIRMEEEISSMASSPLCSCVVVGSSFGYLYFVDCTVPAKPRIVLSERPYEVPIRRLKFDNYGRFVVTSAEDKVVTIWSAVPSSGFPLLGSTKMSSVVKDVAAFSRKGTEGTLVFVLTENESKKGVLSKMLLPATFISSFKYFHKDGFGTLSTDELGMQSLELDYTFTKVEVHCELGVLLHSGPGSDIYRVDPWKWVSFKSAKLIFLVTPKDAKSWCLSSDQNWMAMVRKVQVSQAPMAAVYEGIELRRTACIAKNENAPCVMIASEWGSEPCLGFSNCSNSLICGEKNGDLVNCKWTYKCPWQRVAPEWFVHCISHFDVENRHLASMDREELIDRDPLTAEPVTDSPQYKGEAINFLDACVLAINYKLDLITDEEFFRETYGGSTVETDHLRELSTCNRDKLLLAFAERIPDDVKNSLDSIVKDQTKSVSSINNQVLVEAYTWASIERDSILAKNLDMETSGNGDESKAPRFRLADTVKAKCKVERLSAIKSLLRSICYYKTSFNAEFDTVCGKRQKASDEVDESNFQARTMSQSLPSDAEKDFWTASVENAGVFLDAGKDSDDENSENSDPLTEVQQSIVDLLRSSSVIQQTFDSSVDDLCKMKQFCDFSILGSEMKMYAILLFDAIEDDISDWRRLFENSSKALEANVIELRKMEKVVCALGEDTKRTFEWTLRSEREMSKKLEKKCLKMDSPGTLLDQVKDQIERGLDQFIKVYESSPNLSIEPEGFSAQLNDFTERFESPSAMPKPVSEKFRHLVTCLLALGITWWHIRRQLLFVADTIESSYDCYQKLKKNIDDIDQALKLMTMLVSKFCIKFESVLTLLEEATLVSENVAKVKGGASLKSLPTQDQEMWKDIGQKTLRVLFIKQQLNEIECLYNHVKETNSDVLARSQFASQHLNFMENMGKRFEEASQALNVITSVCEEHVDKRKHSAIELLKSAFKG